MVEKKSLRIYFCMSQYWKDIFVAYSWANWHELLWVVYIYWMCGALDKIGFLIIQNDGFELDKKVVVIADTSRKQDHDPAATRYISWKFSVSCWSLPEPIGLFSNSFYMCS